MKNNGYGLPYIPLSRLRELRESAKRERYEYPFDETNLWYLLIRQEVDRITIEQLQRQLRDAKYYQGVEAYPCPLCEYRDDIFIKNCALHQQIDELTEELAKSEAAIRMYEKQDD